MLDTKDILHAAEIAEERYGDAHTTFRHLRRFWDGHIWEDEQAMTRSLVSVFRDLRHGGAEADREPDVRVTLPLIETVVGKFMGLLTTTPQINVLTPPIGYNGLRKEETCRALADQNEKFLYGTWEYNKVRRHFSRQAWYLPLMGCCFIGAQPDFKEKKIKYVTRSPEWASPFWNADFTELEAMVFRWSVPADVASRQYGADVLAYVETTQNPTLANRLGFGGKGRQGESNPVLDIIEYWDRDSKTTLVAGHVQQSVKHDLGFVPWVMPQFYQVPDHPYGKGVVEGNVSLFQKLNMLDSLELQAILENVFARLVIINPAVAPADIDNGPGGVIPVGLGGDVKWVGPPPLTADLSNSMNRSLDYVERGTHLPGTMYGEGAASSITTGKAQQESMMPTGNIVEYVQGNIGDAWQRVNEMTVEMAGKLFTNRKVFYMGAQWQNKGLAAALSTPERFQIELAGKDLAGWVRHELTFQPMLDLHEKVVMLLQELGGGLVSKRFVRHNIGIVDNAAMEEEILEEQLRDQKLAALMGMAQSGAVDPSTIEQWFYAMEKGGTAVDPAAASGAPGLGAPGGALPPLPPMPGAAPGQMPPGGAPPGLVPPGPPGAGAVTLPGAQNPGENPALPGLPSGSSGGPKQGQFTLSGAIGDFGRLKKLKGRVFLVGEIVARQATDGPVEVAITNPVDKATIINGLPDAYHGHLRFITVKGDPTEQHVEVGPGKKPEKGGQPSADHPDTVVANDPGAFSPTSAGPQFNDQPVMATGSHSLPPLASNYGTGGANGPLRG